MTKLRTLPALAAALSLLALSAAQASTPAPAGLQSFGATVLLTKHGADDPVGDDRGGKGRGSDDPAGHTWMVTPGPILAKHGADDPAGDDRGGNGRGTDDGPNHT
jgi:cytochrome oxidase Cu insertion factor (SCO1/SenC/PrrC family)